MTRELLNTLFVGTEGAYVRAQGETLRIELDRELLLQVPVQHLGAIVLLGRVGISTEAICRCAQDGRSLVFLDDWGRYRARVVGPTGGNVLLRKAQYETQSNPAASAAIARMIVAGKLRNSRNTLLRGARDTRRKDAAEALRGAAQQLADLLAGLESCTDADAMRGYEGQGAAVYFENFDHLLSSPGDDFTFKKRTRRPPKDRLNCLMSLTYSLITNDCTAAIEGVGLDPQIGFLHTLRPGRPALALDLVEEFRSCMADRLTLSLVNRKQVKAEDFEEREGGSVVLTSQGRKTVLAAYQQRKKEEVSHPLLVGPVPLGLVPHLQARLLARHLRGELAEYPPYLSR